MAIVDGGPHPIVRPGDKALLVIPLADWDEPYFAHDLIRRLEKEFRGVTFVAIEMPGAQPSVPLIYRP